MKMLIVVTMLLSPLFAFADPFNETKANELLTAANQKDPNGKTAWDKAETITVELSEFKFSPNLITLVKETAVKIVLKNVGAAPHYFTATDFFKQVATRKFQSKGTLEQPKPDVEFKAPYFTAVELYPSKVAEAFIIPMEVGEFPVICTIAGHQEHGMVGTIKVVENR